MNPLDSIRVFGHDMEFIGSPWCSSLQVGLTGVSLGLIFKMHKHMNMGPTAEKLWTDRRENFFYFPT